jgi:hypothetical protein
LADANQADTGSEVFKNLVKTLSNEERRDLLRRLSVQDTEELPDLGPAVPEPVKDWEQVFRTYSWFRRLVLWIRKFFRGVELSSLVQEQILNDLAVRIEHKVPGFFNLRIGMVFTPFYRELERLFASFEPFRAPFRTAYGPRRSEFVAFLTALEFPELQDKVIALADFPKIGETHPERSLKEIKTIIDGDFRSLLDSVPQEQRKGLNETFRALNAFRALCLFPADKLLAPFSLATWGGQPGNASLAELHDALLELTERLWAMSSPVPQTGLEALFLFHHGERFNSLDVDLETPVSDFLEKAALSWQALRDFHHLVPLVDLGAWMQKDSSWVPSATLAPPEDWLGQFRRFWQARLDGDFELYEHERKTNLVLSEIYQFLEITQPEFFKDAFYPPYYPGRLPRRGELTLLFLRNFMERVFVPKMNPLLKIVLLEGDFYKRNNRGVFTDCYNALLQISDQILGFQRRFAPEGEWGKKLGEIPKDEGEEKAFVQIREVFLAAGDWVDEYLPSVMLTLATFQEVLRGLVKGVSGGKYDTLSNLNSIGGKANGVFRKELEVLLKKWEKFFRILQDLEQIR